MEITYSVWQIGLIALVAGALIGVLAYRLFAPSVRRADQVKSDLDATRDELRSYKENVNEHFDKTAELVNDLTQNYVKVYQHLAAGAQSLGDGKRFDNLLEQQPGKVAIAVDDESPAAQPIDAESTVDAAATTAADAPAEARDERTAAGIEAGAAETAAVKTATAEPESVAAPSAAVESDRAASSGEAAASDNATADAERRADAGEEPVLNVDALDEAIDKADRKSAGSAVPESKPDGEVRTTTH